MPTEQREVLDKGEVSLRMLSDLGLQDIYVRFLPAQVAYSLYLANLKMDLNDLKL